MEITAFKCEQCGAVIETLSAYEKHMEVHRCLILLEGEFPSVKDTNCDFANGGWCVQRDEEWLRGYKKAVEELVGPGRYTPWSYAWFRCLDDGGSPFYGVACRVMNVCPTCYREWGQAFYANNCDHKADK